MEYQKPWYFKERQVVLPSGFCHLNPVWLRAYEMDPSGTDSASLVVDENQWNGVLDLEGTTTTWMNSCDLSGGHQAAGDLVSSQYFYINGR